MNRSAQQPPTSPKAESGSDGEETAATATVAEPKPKPEPEPAEAKAGPEAGTEPAEAEQTAAQGGTTEPEAEAEAEPESGAVSGSRSESEADPGAAAAAKSRLPALVRTVTATAMDRPQQTGPVGRPGKAVLAGAAVGGALLVAVPFLVLGGNDDKNRTAPTAAETVLGGNGRETPGEFAVTRPDARSSGEGKKDSGKRGKPVQEAPASAPAKDKGEGGAEQKNDVGQKDVGQQDQPKKQGGEKESGGNNNPPPAGAGSGVILGFPVSLHSHLSGRCIDVPGSDFSDGKKLFVWDCNNSDAQKWQFASDGTVRIKDKCLDVANADFSDGTPIQIAWCNGNAAQKFELNPSHDLVNTVVGKCVDIKDNNRDNGASLELWSCAGTDNQKWSV